MEYKITKIRLSQFGSTTEHITDVMLSNGSTLSVATVVHNILTGNKYYYTVGGGKVAHVEVATAASGRRYIRTHRDNTTSDNLLSLLRF